VAGCAQRHGVREGVRRTRSWTSGPRRLRRTRSGGKRGRPRPPPGTAGRSSRGRGCSPSQHRACVPCCWKSTRDHDGGGAVEVAGGWTLTVLVAMRPDPLNRFASWPVADITIPIIWWCSTSIAHRLCCCCLLRLACRADCKATCLASGLLRQPPDVAQGRRKTTDGGGISVGSVAPAVARARADAVKARSPPPMRLLLPRACSLASLTAALPLWSSNEQNDRHEPAAWRQQRATTPASAPCGRLLAARGWGGAGHVQAHARET